MQTENRCRLNALEIYAFMEAADESKRKSGAVVSLVSIIQKLKRNKVAE
ncbi:MAG: hypothetical protein ACR2KZ_18355 [Segetibacter sp.]